MADVEILKARGTYLVNKDIKNAAEPAAACDIYAKDKLDTYVDTLVRETWRNSRTLFLCFTEEDRKLFHRGHRNIPSIVAGKKGLQQNRVSLSPRWLEKSNCNVPSSAYI